MPGGNDRVRIAALDDVDGAAHRTVLFAADGQRGRVLHCDDLGRVDQFETIVGSAEFAQFRLDARLIADQIEFGDLAIFAKRGHRPRNDVLGGKIPTHRIDGQFHLGKDQAAVTDKT